MLVKNNIFISRVKLIFRAMNFDNWFECAWIIKSKNYYSLIEYRRKNGADGENKKINFDPICITIKIFVAACWLCRNMNKLTSQLYWDSIVMRNQFIADQLFLVTVYKHRFNDFSFHFVHMQISITVNWVWRIFKAC